MQPWRIIVVGAGMIGRRHVDAIETNSRCVVAGLVDPSPDAAAYAAEHKVPLYRSLAEALATKPDGVIVATPNHLHVKQAMQCVGLQVPVLIEKPVAPTLAEGEALLAAAVAAGAEAKIMVGHHRQHGSVMTTAVEAVRSGRLGRLVAVVGTVLFYKAEPDGYFDGPNAWRRAPGGGPVLINMIHEVGNMRALAGDIVEVSALTSNATRGFAVEDTAAISLRFASGALGTFTVSDTAASSRSWEHTSGEDVAGFGRAHRDNDCYLVAGTDGTLAIPSMRLERYASAAEHSWRHPLMETKLPLAVIDPLAAQIENFCDVIAGTAAPRVSLRDGIENLRVVDAIHESARTGRRVVLTR